MNTYPTPFGRAWNLRPWRRSPLMRTSDRVQSVVHAVLIALIVAAVPVCAWLAGSAHSALTAHSRAVPVHDVPAIADADAQVRGAYVPFNELTVPVHWTVDGVTHTGWIHNGLAHKNDWTSVSVRPDGSQAPQTDSGETIVATLGVAVGAFAIAAALVTTMWHSTSELLSLWGRAQWSREWELIAPRRRNHR